MLPPCPPCIATSGPTAAAASRVPAPLNQIRVEATRSRLVGVGGGQRHQRVLGNVIGGIGEAEGDACRNGIGEALLCGDRRAQEHGEARDRAQHGAEKLQMARLGHAGKAVAHGVAHRQIDRGADQEAGCEHDAICRAGSPAISVRKNAKRISLEYQNKLLPRWAKP